MEDVWVSVWSEDLAVGAVTESHRAALADHQIAVEVWYPGEPEIPLDARQILQSRVQGSSGHSVKGIWCWMRYLVLYRDLSATTSALFPSVCCALISMLRWRLRKSRREDARHDIRRNIPKTRNYGTLHIYTYLVSNRLGPASQTILSI
jgi:hypothetical protein